MSEGTIAATAHCVNPECDNFATTYATVFGKVVGQVCDRCMRLFELGSNVEQLTHLQQEVQRLRMAISVHYGLKGKQGDDNDYWLWAAIMARDWNMAIEMQATVDDIILIRARNRSSFRSGEWGRIVALEMVTRNNVARPCYVVEFIDGVRDRWPVYDRAAGYELRRGQETFSPKEDR